MPESPRRYFALYVKATIEQNRSEDGLRECPDAGQRDERLGKS